MTNLKQCPFCGSALISPLPETAEVQKLVNFWFSPWGAAKSAQWEEISGDRDFSADVMLDLIRAALEEGR